MNAPTLRWPPVADEPRLATIESFVLIGRPAQAVFEFATNASLWHYWHPATAAVTATPPRPLTAGERVTESIRAGGQIVQVIGVAAPGFAGTTKGLARDGVDIWLPIRP